MKIIHNPHDKFFKKTFGNVSITKDFIKHYLPQEIIRILDIETLTPVKDSFINRKLKEAYSDLLFSIKFGENEGFIYFLFEHKSYPEHQITLQLLNYMTEIWKKKINKEKERELPIVIPLVFYHGAQNWNIPQSLGELLTGFEALSKDVKQYIPDFNYLLYDFSLLSNQEIKGLALLRASLDILKHIQTKDKNQLYSVFIDGINLLLSLNIDQSSKGYHLDVYIRYVMSVREDIDIKKVTEKLSDEGRTKLMTVAERLKEEGRKEGIHIGERKKQVEIAKNLLQMGLGVKQITIGTGLTAEEIEKIKRELTK